MTAFEAEAVFLKLCVVTLRFNFSRDLHRGPGTMTIDATTLKKRGTEVDFGKLITKKVLRVLRLLK